MPSESRFSLAREREMCNRLMLEISSCIAAFVCQGLLYSTEYTSLKLSFF